MVAGRLVAMVKRARIVKSAGGICGRRFLQCGRAYQREPCAPEHARDFRKARGGHVGGLHLYQFFSEDRWGHGAVTQARCR